MVLYATWIRTLTEIQLVIMKSVIKL